VSRAAWAVERLPVRRPAWVESERPLHCTICDEPLVLRSRTTPNPAAPEMLLAPPGAWLGYVVGDVDLELVVTCSVSCTERLLSY